MLPRHDPGHLVKNLLILNCMISLTENDSRVSFIHVEMSSIIL